MLDNLRKVNWAGLEMASGSASALPDMIEDLTTDDPDDFEEAILGLSANICEHGIVFDSTIAAIPFLIELLEADGALDAAAIVDLLAQIAESRDMKEILLPPVHDYEFMPAEPEEYVKDDEEMQWSQDAYDAVGKGLSVFRRLLNDDDALVRTSAAALLELYPSAATESAVAMKAAVEIEDDIPTMTDMMLSLRDLVSNAVMAESDRTAYVEFFASLFQDETDPTLRLASAISVAKLQSSALSQAMIDLIGDAISNPATYSTYVEDTLENPVHEALPTLLDLPAEKRTPIMLDALRATQDTGNARNLALGLLIHAFGQEPLKSISLAQERRQGRNWAGAVIEEVQAERGERIPIRTELSPTQREIVEAIVESDTFWVAPGNILYFYGLPTSRSEMLEYLDDPSAFTNR